MINETNIIHARSESGVHIKQRAPWVAGQPVEFQYFPGGLHSIRAEFKGKAIELTVLVDESTADAAQASFEEWQTKFPQQRCFGCFEHLERDASVWPLRFEWKGDENGEAEGVYVTAEPSEEGARHVNGRIHRSWSPSFLTDASYDEAELKDGAYRFPPFSRGSEGNPALITGIAFCCGSLTNKPAFKNIAPVKARQAGPSGGQTVGSILDLVRSAASAKEAQVSEILEREAAVSEVLNSVAARQAR